jgi:hypothetical protein
MYLVVFLSAILASSVAPLAPTRDSHPAPIELNSKAAEGTRCPDAKAGTLSWIASEEHQSGKPSKADARHYYICIVDD